jgi:hypothetical protein
MQNLNYCTLIVYVVGEKPKIWEQEDVTLV